MGLHPIGRTWGGDFTFVQDTVRSTVDLLEDLVARPVGHHDIVYVGGGQSRTMGDLIGAVEDLSGARIYVASGEPISAGMAATEADFGLIEGISGRRPLTPLRKVSRAVYSGPPRGRLGPF